MTLTLVSGGSLKRGSTMVRSTRPSQIRPTAPAVKPPARSVPTRPGRTPVANPRPTSPPRTPRPAPPRPAPVREPVRSQRTAPTRIDKRESPTSGWSIGSWWRRSPVALAAAVFFDGSKTTRDQGIGNLSPAFVNNTVAPDWPAQAAEPVMRKGKLVGMVIHPVDVPVIAPVPVHIPDVVPNWQPAPSPRPRVHPRARPTPAPIELPDPRQRIDYRTGVRPRPSQRPKTQAEVTIVVERVGGPSRNPSSPPSIRVRAVRRFKYQIYANSRRIDAKGVYLRLQGFITATFGTLTEVQDFIEAAAWNIVDKRGVPAMLKARGAALDATEGIENGIVRGALVNFRSYAEAFDGLMDGRYQLDLGGFAFDYAMAQAGDREVAMQSKFMQKMAKNLGLDTVMGVDGMLGMQRRLHGQSRNERMSYVREIHKEWESSFKGRVYWSRQGIRSA